MLHGGAWRAALPAHASMSGRIGILPGESLAEVRTQLQYVVDQVAEGDPWLRDHPPTLTWDNDGLPGWEQDLGSPLVLAMADGQVAGGMPRSVLGLSAGCDAGTIHRSGSPVVVFGPGDMALAHSANERLDVLELDAAIRVLTAGLDNLSDRTVAAVT